MASFLDTQGNLLRGGSYQESMRPQNPSRVLVYCDREILQLPLKAQVHPQGVLAGQVRGARLLRTSQCWISFSQTTVKSAWPRGQPVLWRSQSNVSGTRIPKINRKGKCLPSPPHS